MSRAKGSAFLLKISDGNPNPFYSTVAGLRSTKMRIDANFEAGPSEGDWREIVPGGGKRSVSIEAAGIFLGSAAEAQVRGLALAGAVTDYELSFEGGEKMRGKFLVQRLDYAGDFGGERNYTIALESSGPVVAV